MDLAPQLAFNGECKQVFEFYAKLFGGEIAVMNTFGGNEYHKLPPGSVAGPTDKIRYAELRFTGGVLRGNDVANEQYTPMRGCNLSLHLRDAYEACRIFSGLSVEGEITMPLGKVDWAELFGMVVDRFGVPWLILALKEWRVGLAFKHCTKSYWLVGLLRELSCLSLWAGPDMSAPRQLLSFCREDTM